jgi:1-acyl-sn-glycerol-3-phosphate acyltransferase
MDIVVDHLRPQKGPVVVAANHQKQRDPSVTSPPVVSWNSETTRHQVQRPAIKGSECLIMSLFNPN